MPWKPSDSQSHTRKASTPAKKEQWSAAANAVLKKTHDEGQAIRVANAAVGKPKKSK